MDGYCLPSHVFPHSHTYTHTRTPSNERRFAVGIFTRILCQIFFVLVFCLFDFRDSHRCGWPHSLRVSFTHIHTSVRTNSIGGEAALSRKLWCGGKGSIPQEQNAMSDNIMFVQVCEIDHPKLAGNSCWLLGTRSRHQTSQLSKTIMSYK